MSTTILPGFRIVLPRMMLPGYVKCDAPSFEKRIELPFRSPQLGEQSRVATLPGIGQSNVLFSNVTRFSAGAFTSTPKSVQLRNRQLRSVMSSLGAYGQI